MIPQLLSTKYLKNKYKIGSSIFLEECYENSKTKWNEPTNFAYSSEKQYE